MFLMKNAYTKRYPVAIIVIHFIPHNIFLFKYFLLTAPCKYVDDLN